MGYGLSNMDNGLRDAEWIKQYVQRIKRCGLWMKQCGQVFMR